MTTEVKRRAGVRLLLALLAPLLAYASPASTQTVDIASGRKRAEVCMACHGENGISVIPGIPNLAGQEREYLIKALLAYRGGQLRQDPTMFEMAKPLSDADIANLAAFWNNLHAK